MLCVLKLGGLQGKRGRERLRDRIWKRKEASLTKNKNKIKNMIIDKLSHNSHKNLKGEKLELHVHVNRRVTSLCYFLRPNLDQSSPSSNSTLMSYSPLGEPPMVNINWVFFDPNCPQDIALPIDIPFAHFTKACHNCADFFINELREEFGFIAKKRDIFFYQVRGTTLRHSSLS